MLNTPIPKDLCPAHHELARQWRNNHYSPWNPSEWPGGGPLMDNRTSHEERARDWDRQNLEQMELAAHICRSGRSPQCTPRETPTAVVAGPAPSATAEAA